MNFVTQYGPWAAIAGGSEGVGAAFAHELAEKGLNILLVARTPARLERLAAELRARYPDRLFRVLATDLSVAEGADAVLAATENTEIGLLIYNAGACSRYSNFLDADLDFNLRLTTLNVLNKMRLVHALGRSMRQRRRGGILLVGSTSYLAGSPGFSTYAGVKAFTAIFSEGLWHEMRPFGVHVLGYIVSSTATPAMARNYPEAAGHGADPEFVAREGLLRLADGPITFVPGSEKRIASVAGLSRQAAVQTMYDGCEIYRTSPVSPE